MMRPIKMTLNIIMTPIIITHAQGFEPIAKFFGEGSLAAPYCGGGLHSLSPYLYQYQGNFVLSPPTAASSGCEQQLHFCDTFQLD